MKPHLNSQDCFGYTPLHVAVTSSEKLGSTRNVKALLLRGADRNVKDSKGRTPMDHIPENHDEDMKKELISQLEPQ